MAYELLISDVSSDVCLPIERALGYLEFSAVDGEGDQISGRCRVGLGGVVLGSVGCSHETNAPVARTDRRGSNGHPLLSKCATYSSRKYFREDMIGLVAPSPNAQKDFPRMVSEMSRSLVRSA